MQIRRLTLSGFKSFVEPAELRIEPGLTGIVGPNGCGKSNLLEAIRWVMGEGSAKSLRGGAMDDVIFAGTATRPAREFAEVVVLAEHDAANDAGNDNTRDLEIVRRIERGAGSAYRINGRDARAKDVALIFADSATGAHSPALVSQGRIGAIIAAKPADRRAMLEEAAGISGLHVRRKDAETRLRATAANLERIDTMLTDIEARASALRRQAKAAERYRKLSEEIRTAEARLIYARWRDAAAAAATARAQAQDADADVARAAEAQRGAAAWQAQAVTKLAGLRGAAQAARDGAAAAGHALAALTAERASADRRIAELAAQSDRLATDRAREGQLAHDATDALERLGDEAKALVRRIADADARRPDLAIAVAAAETAAKDAEVALAQGLAAQAREHAEVRVAEAAVGAAQARRARAERDLNAVADQIAGFGEEARLADERDRATSAILGAEAEAVAARAATDASDRARDAAAAARDAAENAVAAAHALCVALESEARSLVKALESTGSRDRVIDKVRAAPGYERALAAALGDDLEAPLGATGRGWAGARALADDPVLPSASSPLADHVQAPGELARRLAQVAVVETDTGQGLAVGQRLVTRDGTLRRWDGYVSDREGASSAERFERVNRLAVIEAELPIAQAALSEARDAGQTAAQSLSLARAAGDAARRRLTACEVAVSAAMREASTAESTLERLVARRTEAQERLVDCEHELREARADHDDAERARVRLPDGMATANAVAALQVAGETCRSVLATARADHAAIDRVIAADRERQAAVQSEIRGWKSRSGAAAARIGEIDTRAKAVKIEADSLADAPGRIDQALADAQAANGQAMSAAAVAAEAERAAEAELRTHEAQLAQLAEALATAREARAGAAARAENQELRRVEMGRVSGERFECPPPILPERVGFASDDVSDASAESSRHERLSLDRERIGPVNLVAETELAELEAGREASLAERDELAEAISRLRGSIGSLNREGRTRLLSAFEAVNGHFQRLFSTLFNGGQAHLALIDSDDPLEAGLEIFAQPPGKRLQSLTLLSGGEQALTAVALIFALFLTNPAPICVLDEVDAPLDDANIERFCDLLDAMTRETDTRYLIVTHNAVTMARMHRLFGVTMIEQGISRLVSVDLGGAEALLAAE